MKPDLLRRIVLLAGLLAVLSLAAGMAVIQPVEQAHAQENVLTVHDQSAEINFPESIRFNLGIEAPEMVEQVELRYQTEYSGVARAERPSFDPGTSVDTGFDVNLRTEYLPPGVDIRYRWVITLANGEEVETEEREFFFIDNRYDWDAVTDGPVSIYFYEGGSQFGNTAMDVTTRTIERFNQDFDVQMEEPINIVLYGSVDEFREALPYNSPEWIGGFAEPDENLIVAGIAPGDTASAEMGRMLTHEVVHLMVAQATLNPFNTAPRWLDEGLAINYQEVEEERYDQILDQAIDEYNLIPVRALRSSFPSDPDLAVQSYAQSESIIQFLIEEHGHAAVASILSAYQEGVSHDEATEVSLGMSLEELDEAWKAWLGYDSEQAGDSETSVEPLTPGALERVENVLTRFGVLPVLALGGLIVIILGISRMVQAFRTEELDEDVDPEVEYYGQDTVYESEPDYPSEGPYQP